MRMSNGTGPQNIGMSDVFQMLTSWSDGKLGICRQKMAGNVAVSYMACGEIVRDCRESHGHRHSLEGWGLSD